MPSWVFQNLHLFLKNLSERRYICWERLQLVCMWYAEGAKPAGTSEAGKKAGALGLATVDRKDQ